jgi:hypothetical protein
MAKPTGMPKGTLSFPFRPRQAVGLKLLSVDARLQVCRIIHFTQAVRLRTQRRKLPSLPNRQRLSQSRAVSQENRRAG